MAVSPQIPERLVDIKRRHGFEFSVVSDPGNALGRHFGTLYEYDEASKASAKASVSFIGETTGTGTWELPMPTVVVIDGQGVVAFASPRLAGAHGSGRHPGRRKLIPAAIAAE